VIAADKRCMSSTTGNDDLLHGAGKACSIQLSIFKLFD
jgi:hypothetical protein